MTSIFRTAIRAALPASFCLSMIASTTVVHAQDDWAVGGAVFVGQSPYRSYETQVMPLPILTYEGDRFFIGGSGAGVYAYKTETDRLGIGVQYDPWNFDPSDSSDWAMKQLDKRRSSLMAGISYRHDDADWGSVGIKLMGDVLGRSHGFVGDIAYQYPIQIDQFRIVPGIGMEWHSKKYNEYYFGVTEKESNRSGLARHSPGGGVSPYLSLNASYSFDEDWSVFVSGSAHLLSETAKDSPMTDQSYSTSFGAGLVYTF